MDRLNFTKFIRMGYEEFKPELQHVLAVIQQDLRLPVEKVTNIYPEHENIILVSKAKNTGKTQFVTWQPDQGYW